MRILLQRIARATVESDGVRTPEAGPGLLGLVGFRSGDSGTLLRPMAAKMAHLRIFAALHTTSTGYSRVRIQPISRSSSPPSSTLSSI